MGVFSKLFGGGKAEQAGSEHRSTGFPTTVELVPGQLRVTVYSHGISGVDGVFWTVVSSGLKAHGQAEIVATLARRPDEAEDAVPGALISFFAQVHGLAQGGQRVGAGEWSEFGEAGFLSPHIRGVGYVEAQRIEGVEVPSGAIAAVSLDAVEMQAVKVSGLYRVLARHGQATRVYPFPCWCDRDRHSGAQEGGDESSMLHKVARVWIKPASLLWERNKVTLTVSSGGAEAFQQALAKLPDDVALAFLVPPSPHANGWLVWQPGQQEPAGITPPGSDGSRLTGFHLLIAAGVDEDSIRVGEDGFWMLLRSESWERLRRALLGHDRFEMSSYEEGGMSFGLRWEETTYHNPVDGSVLRSEGWREYRPKSGGDQRTEVRLLVSEEQMAAAIEVELLAAYITQISAIAATLLEPATGPRVTIYLQFELSPGEPAQVKTACEPSGQVPESVVGQLADLRSPEVRSNVAFQVVVQTGVDA